MTDLDPTVDRFVDRHLEVTDDESRVHLDELWKWYRGPPTGVAYEKFKWHLIQALPDSVESKPDNIFEGVRIAEPRP